MNKKKYICFYPGGLHLGGVGRLTINLAEELVKRGYKVDFFLTMYEGEYLKDIPKEVNVIKGKGGALKSITLFYKYVKQNKPDVIVAARDYLNFISMIVARLANKNTLVVPSIHVDYTGMPKSKKSFRSILLHQGLKMLYRGNNHIVAVSKGVAKDFSKNYDYPYEKVKVIYNPTYKEENYKITKPILNAEFFEPDCPVIIGVGRLVEQKNFSLLVKAFIKINKNRKVKLVLLGEGHLREDLESEISSAGLSSLVYMPGFVVNPIDYIKLSNVFVLSSAYEGFGNVLVEAMGTGIPVVSTDCPSGPAEILENGKYGELVSLDNVEEMVKAINKSIDFPLDNSIIINRAKDFSVENITDEYLSLFEN